MIDADKLAAWRKALGFVIGRDTSDRARIEQVLRELDDAWVEAVRESVKDAPVEKTPPRLAAAIAELTPSTFEAKR